MDNYISEIEKELREASEKLTIISEVVSKLDLGEEAGDIQYGSKVLITWISGETIEGRVWDVKSNGAFGINRDGYAGTINLGVSRTGLTEHTLKNLSVGTYGKLEREKWVLSEKISEIKKRLEQAIESRVRGIKESFNTKQISKTDIIKIIDSTEFKEWHKMHSDTKNFPLIDSWPQTLRSAIVKEFLLQSTDKHIYDLLLRDKI